MMSLLTLNRSCYYWGILLIGLMSCLQLAAQSPAEELLQQGNDAYADGQFQMAAQRYDSVLSLGFTSATLHYNLGNAYYQQELVGPAILHYEKALALDPSYENAEFNLRLANQRVVDRIEPMPQFVLSRWWAEIVETRSAGFWSWVAVAWMWLALIAVGLLLFLPGFDLRRGAFIAMMTFGVLAVLSLGLACYQQVRMGTESYAIVMSPNAYVKNAPNGPTDLLILHEGVKVERLDEVGDWTQIRLRGANIGEIEGFVKTEALASI